METRREGAACKRRHQRMLGIDVRAGTSEVDDGRALDMVVVVF
jgi:hypothetical protein